MSSAARILLSVVLPACLVAGCTYNGRVIDAADGHPLDGVEVSSRNGWLVAGRGTSDREGRFEVSIPTYAETVFLQRDGYKDLRISRREFVGIDVFRMQRR